MLCAVSKRKHNPSFKFTHSMIKRHMFLKIKNYLSLMFRLKVIVHREEVEVKNGKQAKRGLHVRDYSTVKA